MGKDSGKHQAWLKRSDGLVGVPKPSPDNWTREIPPAPLFNNDGDAELWSAWEEYDEWHALHSWGKPKQSSQ